jgi:DNA mismatch repair protein MutS
MVLDEATIKNLEIIRNQQDGGKNRTLFSVLNRTRTAMGKRFLERAILQPLLNVNEIENRLNVVQYFYEYHALAQQVQKLMDEVSDLERLLSRLMMRRFTARDFPTLSKSLQAASKLRAFLEEQPLEDIQNLAKKIVILDDVTEKINATILDEPALTPEQGRVIRPGHNAEIDRLYNLTHDAKNWVLDFEEREKKKLGIPTLKVKYNRVFGYYIEVSRGQTGKVPEGYSRKQTLKGAERYTNEELQKFEEETLSASETLIDLENKEIDELLRAILAESRHIQSCAEAIGEIDTYLSFAIAALEHRFVRPKFNCEGFMQIADARHPIVEKYYTKEAFIPNDIFLDTKNNIIKIITGPNMSGKSTYIRTAAIVQLMSQIGSFVPAREANISLADRIFTRIGASDNISMGESTFLVEMAEAAIILNNATSDSLVIMDEVGRGTSTYDGLAIAWAVVEYLARYTRAKTLFATHYHELTRLGGKNGVVNYTVLVKEKLDGVEFLHKVVPGSADRSYGIHVARLAGIPRSVTARAAQILERLEKQSRARAEKEHAGESEAEQLVMFNAANHRVIRAIQEIDINTISPIEALNELHRLKKEIE